MAVANGKMLSCNTCPDHSQSKQGGLQAYVLDQMVELFLLPGADAAMPMPANIQQSRATDSRQIDPAEALEKAFER